MGDTEPNVRKLPVDVRAKLDECKRIRAKVAADSRSANDYSETLAECDALESRYVMRES